MELKELERLINEKIKGREFTKGTFSDLTFEVKGIVQDILKNNKNVYVYDYSGNIVIRRSCCSDRYNQITIKIKKKQLGSEYVRFYGYQMMYAIDKVEIPEYEKFDSIEGFVYYCDKIADDEEKYQKNKAKKFEEELEKLNVDFKKFYDLMQSYRNLNYDAKEELAKKYAGNKYYSYY